MMRRLLRDHAPRPVRDVLRRVRALAAPRPIEESVLAPYRFEPAADGTRRLNLVIPSLDPADAFGGVNTCVEFLLKLLAELRASGPVDLRMLVEQPQALSDTIVPSIARATGLTTDGITIADGRRGAVVPTRSNDVFMVYNWWTSLNIQPVLESQADHFGRRHPKIYFLQDYEPQFYPFSSANLLARAALDIDWPIWPIINSTELAAYHTRMQHRADRLFVFEPRLNPSLRPSLDNLATVSKRRLLLVYGRPTIPRNCFTIIRKTLSLWAQEPVAQGWEVLSAGMKHDPITLGNGLTLASMGRLSLEAYGRILSEAAVGLSLMASPHPSYPPLEMAHFGIKVLTNDYTDKKLSQAHSNISSFSDARPEYLALKLVKLCGEANDDLSAGVTSTSYMPKFMDNSFDCLGSVADSLVELWG